MNPLLEQFLSESREFLQSISEKLLQLENQPDDPDLLKELFRFVHTLKGNSGLFEFPEMTRVLHAAEDLMDAVRNGRLSYTQTLADQLLDAMDFVANLCDEIEVSGQINPAYALDSGRLSEALRGLLSEVNAEVKSEVTTSADLENTSDNRQPHAAGTVRQGTQEMPVYPRQFAEIPEALRMDAFRRCQQGEQLYWVVYRPDEQCFFQGDDPFFTARQTPGLIWGGFVAREDWPKLTELDAYRCLLDFQMITSASHSDLVELYRYVLEQISVQPIAALAWVIPNGNVPEQTPIKQSFIADALRQIETRDLAGLQELIQSSLSDCDQGVWQAALLRWLICLLESIPVSHPVVSLLIRTLDTPTPPDWNALLIAASEAGTVKSGCDFNPEFNPESTPENKAENKPEVSGQSVAAATISPAMAEINLALAQLSEEDRTAIAQILLVQHSILSLNDQPTWLAGRLKAVALVLSNCCRAMQVPQLLSEIDSALATDLAAANSQTLQGWLNNYFGNNFSSQPGRDPGNFAPLATTLNPPVIDSKASTLAEPVAVSSAQKVTAAEPSIDKVAQTASDESVKFGRRAEDTQSSKSLKVDQSKIDRLMNLIGEIIVSKNALPYLAQRAEDQYGVRELAREIKAQYAVINRIAEEMQDAIMQVRMMPVSFVLQRFPRLVRDISRKLGKEVNLQLIGEETEADKNIIEALADPLVHIVRNSLDHGLETPEARRAAGKPVSGTLTIRAEQAGGRVVIEIIDDGKGINPAIVKMKAFEKGLIDEATLERISDREAVNLVFAAGFSTSDTVSDLSGRGVGMDVVRSAVERVNGSIALDSETGKGTRIRISLPLSMAVTQVMIVESDGQLFGVPMDHVVETVRIAESAIYSVMHSQTTVLRNRIVPLKALNALLGLSAPPLMNEDNEVAILVARYGNEIVGLMVDDFRQTVDVIQKPLSGILAGLRAYSGSALMGDGSVLMVINIKEML